MLYDSAMVESKHRICSSNAQLSLSSEVEGVAIKSDVNKHWIDCKNQNIWNSKIWDICVHTSGRQIGTMDHTPHTQRCTVTYSSHPMKQEHFEGPGMLALSQNLN